MMLPLGGVEDGFGPLADLLAAGHAVVNDVFPGCKVAVHVSSLEIAPWFFEMLSQSGYTPDVVAVSQYSKWDLQSIDEIAEAIASLNQKHRGAGLHCRDGLRLDHAMVRLDQQHLVEW